MDSFCGIFVIFQLAAEIWLIGAHIEIAWPDKLNRITRLSPLALASNASSIAAEPGCLRWCCTKTLAGRIRSAKIGFDRTWYFRLLNDCFGITETLLIHINYGTNNGAWFSFSCASSICADRIWSALNLRSSRITHSFSCICSRTGDWDCWFISFLLLFCVRLGLNKNAFISMKGRTRSPWCHPV